MKGAATFPLATLGALLQLVHEGELPKQHSNDRIAQQGASGVAFIARPPCATCAGAGLQVAQATHSSCAGGTQR